MKTIKSISMIKKIIVLLTALSITLVLFSCSKKIAFENSAIIPAARGEVTVKKDNNNNYKVELNLSYLSEPDRLDPPKKTYVVWLVAEDNNPQNVGQIVGTNNLHVKFETVSSSKPDRIFITAENDESTQYPGNVKVLEAYIL
jgi:hypothetical protein